MSQRQVYFRTHLKLLKSKIRSLSGLPDKQTRIFPSDNPQAASRTTSTAPQVILPVSAVSTPPLWSKRVPLGESLKPKAPSVNLQDSSNRSTPPSAVVASPPAARIVTAESESDGFPASQGENLVKCDKCSRTFREDIIEKHISVCAKNQRINRPKFDSKTHRLAGIQVGGKPILSSFVTATPSQPKQVIADDTIPIKRPSWRDKSDQLRAAIGAARSSDPRDRLRYEQELARVNQQCLTKCDFCGRSFNPDAAARHIPICRNKAQMMPRKAPSRPIDKTVAEVTSRVLSKSASVLPLTTSNRTRPGLR